MTQPAREPAPHPDGHRPPSDQAVYGISVASELTGCTPETLRLYERRKLLAPARTDGGTRRYQRRHQPHPSHRRTIRQRHQPHTPGPTPVLRAHMCAGDERVPSPLDRLPRDYTGRPWICLPE